MNQSYLTAFICFAFTVQCVLNWTKVRKLMGRIERAEGDAAFWEKIANEQLLDRRRLEWFLGSRATIRPQESDGRPGYLVASRASIFSAGWGPDWRTAIDEAMGDLNVPKRVSSTDERISFH